MDIHPSEEKQTLTNLPAAPIPQEASSVKSTQKVLADDGRTLKVKKSKKVNWSRIFKYLSYLVTAFILVLYRDVDRYYHYSVKHNTKYNPFSDFRISLVSMVCIFIYRYGSLHFLAKPVEQIMDPRYQGDERQNHAKRMVKWFLDVFYYTTFSVFGYWVIYRGGLMPTWLGGDAECYDSMKGYPYPPEVPYLREYFLIQLGNHYFALVDQFFFKRHEKNHYEMLLHHILTCGLMMLSYQMNLTIPGSIILLAHDPGDVLLCVSRLYSDIKGKRFPILVIIFALNLSSWIYLRLFILPSCLIHSVMKGYFTTEPEIFSIIKFTLGLQLIMVWLLFFMHIYWVGMMIKRAVITITKKKIRTT